MENKCQYTDYYICHSMNNLYRISLGQFVNANMLIKKRAIFEIATPL